MGETPKATLVSHTPVIDVEPKDDNCFTFSKAIIQISEGKKVARRDWPEGFYIYLGKEYLMLRKPDKRDYQMLTSVEDIEADDWYINISTAVSQAGRY